MVVHKQDLTSLLSVELNESRYGGASEARKVGASRGLDICGQATKGIWGMSRCWKAMKGVEVCEKHGGVDKRTLIP